MAAATMTKMVGAPDYDAYVSHLAAAHPDAVPVTRDQFVCDRLDLRYSRPGARCC